MPAPMTKAELFTLLPPNGSLETEQARGRFLAALRLGEALRLPARLIAALRTWRVRRATTLALEALPEAVLRDIGLTRAEIARIAEEAAQRAALAAESAPTAARPAARGRVAGGLPQAA